MFVWSILNVFDKIKCMKNKIEGKTDYTTLYLTFIKLSNHT